MRSIAVMNQKGGVGKTTSSVNLAAALAREGRRVCLMDLDPQGHASFHVGVEAGPDMPTVYDVFTQQTTLDHARQLVGENLSLIPANIDLAATEVELAGTQGQEKPIRPISGASSKPNICDVGIQISIRYPSGRT